MCFALLLRCRNQSKGSSPHSIGTCLYVPVAALPVQTKHLLLVVHHHSLASLHQGHLGWFRQYPFHICIREHLDQWWPNERIVSRIDKWCHDQIHEPRGRAESSHPTLVL